MDRLRVGVIGAGYWGPNIIRNFYQIPESQLKMVVDLRQERLDHVRERYPDVQVSREVKELLDSDVEAVAICTPVSSHYSLAMECLRAGKHILVEKPITRNSQEACEIIALGREKDLVVMAGHTFVYNPAVMALKEIIASGEIGEIYYVNSTRVNLGLYQPDVNVVWDLAPHDVSILLYILGIAPEAASARGGRFAKAGIHDVAYLTLYYSNGIMVDMRVSWLDPCKIRQITIVGSKKMVVYDDIEPVNKIKIYDKGVDVQPYTDTLEEFHLAYRYGDAKVYPLQWQEPLRIECLEFINSIRTATPSRSDGSEGLKVVRVLEAVQKSLLNGHGLEPIVFD